MLQRWSLRRLGLAAGMLFVVGAASAASIGLFFPVENIGASAPECGTGHSMILSAQAVPSAALLPCIASLPSGWKAAAQTSPAGRPGYGSTRTAPAAEAVTVTLTASCDTSGARQIPSDQSGTSRFERPLSLAPGFSGLRYYTFPGGCVTYEFRFQPGTSPVLAVAADSALAFRPRSSLVRHVRRTENLLLCGRGAACPG